MNVLLTIAILGVLGVWAISSYARLVGLRRQVTIRWREVHTSRPAGLDPAIVKERYNLVARQYNASLDAFPGALIGAMAGFKRAEVLRDP